MSRHDVEVQVMDREGLAVTFEPVHADLQHAFLNTGREYLHLKNIDDAAHTVTLKIAQTVDGQAFTSPTVSIPDTTGDLVIGPFPKGIYNQTDGKVYIDFDDGTDVTLAVVQLPAANA